jgi:hypothetical protein
LKSARRRRALAGAPAVIAVAQIVAATSGETGCGAGQLPAETQTAQAEARWEDIFDSTPELLLVLRPRALKEDAAYGSLFRRLLETTRAQSHVVAATSALDAIQDAEEVILAIRLEAPGRASDMVFVARGTRADLDPGKLVDDDGRAVWQPGPPGRVRELVRERGERGDPDAASLFELPGRTWVVAVGEARARGRAAFARPLGRPPVDLDRDALAILRLDGPSLIARVAPLRERGALAAAGKHLESVTLVLPPGSAPSKDAKDGDARARPADLRATLAYRDEDAAAFAEIAVREQAPKLAHENQDSLGWLGDAKVERPQPGKQVVVTASFSPAVVDALLGGGPMPHRPRR